MESTALDIDKAFGDVYRALDLKEQRKAMRGAMRREGNRLKKQAAANLQGSGMGTGTKQKVSKGIRVRVYPDRYGAGFMLSVKPRGRHGVHKNRFGKEKPVLMWAEDGTRLRHTGRRLSSFFSKSRYTGKKVRQYVRGGRSTGRMRRYGFMRRTEETAAQSVEQNLFGDFQRNMRKAMGRL